MKKIKEYLPLRQEPEEQRDVPMELINRYSRRKLGEEEVYIFSLILCDNEIDRDCERFPAASLEALAPLFVGKTGVFDHNPSGKNQTARIFDTRIVRGEKTVPGGEKYAALRAWAYMVRCRKNEDLILEIEAGIKKEVSVGCAVGTVSCSICGAEISGGCRHQKGKVYDGRMCHHLLENPTDAYEWSFVAVPAQRGAGVTKAFRADRADREEESRMNLEKLFEGRGPLTLGQEEVSQIREEIGLLRQKAGLGEEYLDSLRREVVKLAAFAQPELDGAVMEEVAGLMDGRQLKAFAEGLRASAQKAAPLSPQLAVSSKRDKPEPDSAYRI